MEWLWNTLNPAEWIKSPFVRDWLGSNIRHWLTLLLVTKLGLPMLGEHVDALSLNLTNFLIAFGTIGVTALYSAWRSGHDRKALPPPPDGPPAAVKHPMWLVPFMLVAALGVSSIPGCVTPQTAAPVAEYNAKAVNVLGESYRRDLSVLREVIDVQIKVARRLELGEADRELLLSGYITPDNRAVPDKLAADLADPNIDSLLLREVRMGRLSQAEASAWLANYAALLAATNSAPLREAMLAQLLPIEQFDADAEALLGSFDAHALRVAALIEDAKGNADALREFSTTKYTAQDFLEGVGRDAWSWSVVGNVSESKRGDAAALYERLIGRPEESK